MSTPGLSLANRMQSGLALIVLLGLLSGCAYLYQPGPGLDRQIDQWTRQQHYGEAIDVLTRLSAAHPDNTHLKAQLSSVRRHAAAYETTTLDRARKLEKKGNWHDAARLYRQALDNYPGGVRLARAQTEFRQRRTTYINTLEAQIVVNRARYLLSTLPLYQRRSRIADTDSQASDVLEDKQHQAIRLSKQLTAIGQSALAARAYPEAKEAFELSRKLHQPNPVASTGLKTVEDYDRARRKQRARANAAREKIRRAAQVRKYTAQFEQCYQHQQWVCARRALSRLSHAAPRAERLPALRDKLRKKIHAEVKLGMEKGRRLYSQGRIRPALQTWLAVQKLAPDNPVLAAHITRARKVLAKVQELSTRPLRSDSPAGANAPPSAPTSP